MTSHAGGEHPSGGRPSEPSKGRVSPVFLLFVLPVLLLMLVTGAIVFSSVNRIQNEYRLVAAAQAVDTQRLASASRFNQDLAAIQKLVAETLEQAASGRVDQGQVYRAHTAVVNLLGGLEPRLLDLENLQDANPWH
ncbi:MAG: hypothetical protein PSV24_08730 [Rhodoferax sp.]|nr:hypothetical protein [Rhodoferax sp.]